MCTHVSTGTALGRWKVQKPYLNLNGCYLNMEFVVFFLSRWDLGTLKFKAVQQTKNSMLIVKTKFIFYRFWPSESVRKPLQFKLYHKNWKKIQNKRQTYTNKKSKCNSMKIIFPSCPSWRSPIMLYQPIIDLLYAVPTLNCNKEELCGVFISAVTHILMLDRMIM